MSEINDAPHLEADLPTPDDLNQSQLGHAELFGWQITVTPDGGLVIRVPAGKLLDLGDGRFVVGGDKKWVEVRAK